MSIKKLMPIVLFTCCLLYGCGKSEVIAEPVMVEKPMEVEEIISPIDEEPEAPEDTEEPEAPEDTEEPEVEEEADEDEGEAPWEKEELEIPDGYESRELCCGIVATVPVGLKEDPNSGFGMWSWQTDDQGDGYIQISIQIDELLSEEGFDPVPLEDSIPYYWSSVDTTATDTRVSKQCIEEFTTDKTYNGYECLQFVITVTADKHTLVDVPYYHLIESLNFDNFYLSVQN